VEVGSFGSVGEARAACEKDAVARCRREREERPAVDVRIAPNRRGPTKNAKTSQSVAQTARQRAAMVRFKRRV
jgi:hypothetical protein